MERRQFLASLAALGAIALPRAARADGGATSSVAASSGAFPPLIMRTERPANDESPRGVFTQRLTPTDRFYIRTHFDTPVVDAATWRVQLGGLVDKPASLSLQDLHAMPQVTVEAVLQCSGNGRALFRPRIPGVQWERGAVGNATWTGVRLRDVLARVGASSSGRFVTMRGAERPTMPKTPAFIRALPLDKALHDDTLVALQMNGAPLPVAHGAPARVVVPGWVADDWVKWITQIDVVDTEPDAFFYAKSYRFPDVPGAPGAAVPPEHMKPMTTMNVKSVIGSVDDGAVIAPGRHEIVGVAWSGDGHGVTKVEVSTDDKTWRPATLEAAGSRYGFRVFRHTWDATPGRHTLRTRATDDAGAVQPDVPVWNPSGYLFNAIDPVVVQVRA